MTDTTITPEERRTWRNEHANWTGRDSDLVVRVRLMDALEAVEASKSEAEAENARLKWLVECMDNYEWCCNRSVWFIAHGVHHEAKATLEAARRVVVGEGEPS